MKYKIIIPAYNAEKTLSRLFTKILKHDFMSNILVVNDGSSDRTKEICEENNVEVISNSTNLGKGEALKKGFQKAILDNCDFVITMDADLQHEPRFIPQFISKYNIYKHGIIIGKREKSLSKMPIDRIMSNTITDSIASVYSIEGINLKLVISILLSIMMVFILFNKRESQEYIIKIVNKLVPLMAIIYIILFIFVIVINFEQIPNMFKNIFYEALGFRQFTGGIFGVAIMQGVKRGLFSNEAGSGNSNYAAASVHNEDEVKQGFVQMFGVFIDTLVICSATAFIVLLAPKSDLTGMALFQYSVTHYIGQFGAPLVIMIMFFFCISTILAVVYYGNSAIYYIGTNKYLIPIYQILIILMVYIGGIKRDLFVWSLADFGLGMMTLINIFVLILVGKESIEKLRKFEKKDSEKL